MGRNENTIQVLGMDQTDVKIETFKTKGQKDNNELLSKMSKTHDLNDLDAKLEAINERVKPVRSRIQVNTVNLDNLGPVINTLKYQLNDLANQARTVKEDSRAVANKCSQTRYLGLASIN
jgi:predicted  nucleic acid-binding Zn-ribbon protein